MKRVKYLHRIVHDVVGDAYEFLIETCLRQEGTFTLVWRDQFQFGESARAIRADLSSLQVRHKKADRWPGTVLIGHDASVITYRVDAAALGVLARPGSLFGWLAPDYPEDLSFSSTGGSLQLVTVSHENEGWILSTQLARTVGQLVTLELEERRAGDEEYFEAAV
jgi:hypothetical protein